MDEGRDEQIITNQSLLLVAVGDVGRCLVAVPLKQALREGRE